MTTITIVVRVKPEKLEEFLQVMRSLNNDSEKQQDSRKSAVYRNIDDQTGFTLIYEWKIHEEHEQYLGAEKFRVLLGALKVLCEESNIRYGCDPHCQDPLQCPLTLQNCRATP